MSLQAPPQDFEQDFEVRLLPGAIDDGERARPQGRGHLAAIVPVRPRSLDHDRRRRLVEATDQLQDLRPGLVAAPIGAIRAPLLEGQAQIDDGDVYAVAPDKVSGLLARFRPERMDTDRLQKLRQAVDPGVLLPAAHGEEEIEAGTAAAWAAPAAGAWQRALPLGRHRRRLVLARNLHHTRTQAIGVPVAAGRIGAATA